MLLTTTILLVVAVLFLSAANGANDNFKGVAALHGGGLASYRMSLLWASATTLLGALCSVYVAHTLLQAFTGKGLVATHIAAQEHFAVAVAAGAGLTVALSASRGVPISTTHALVGALIGAGFMAAGSNIRLSALLNGFLLPLLLSPVLAAIAAGLFGRILARSRASMPDPCVCAAPPLLTADTATPVGGGVFVADSSTCREAHAIPLAHMDARRISVVLQFMLAGAISFARGMNDTPKIAALLVPLVAADSSFAVPMVAVAMFAGGVVGARRVGHTMSHRITELHGHSSMAASLTTSALVILASFKGLPVSTTHVSVGALTGAGVADSGANRGVLIKIGMAWLVTLPFSAALGALVYALVQ